jgi:hypothetical protein
MPDNRKDKQISFLIGVIIGMLIGGLVTATGGVFAYKIYKRMKQDTRYEYNAPAVKKTGQKAPATMKGFYLSFEKKDDIDVFTAGERTSLEISESNATHGKHSLMVKMESGTGFPGIGWEVYDRQAQDWSKANDFHFDVYNNNEDYITLEVKFKSGKGYPKKFYSQLVNLEPQKMNKISIPVENIAGQCDVTQMSYLRIFANSPSVDMVLFFDNIGIRQGSTEDEKADIEDKEVKNLQVAYKKNNQAELKERQDIFVASSLDRIFLDGKTLTKPSFTQSASLSLAKNEYESFQIVISNGKNQLHSVQLEISDLVNEGGAGKIDKRNISWRSVGYIPTKKPYYPVKFIGLWPDPLLPLEKIEINPGITQPLWVTVYVAKDAYAGTYKGKIKVTSGNAILGEIPLSVKVHDFALPLKNHLKTAFGFYEHVTSARYPKKKNEGEGAYQERISRLNEKYILDMLNYRINPILNIDPSSQGGLNRLERYIGFGLSNFSLGKRGGTFGNNWPETKEEIEQLLPVYRAYAWTLKFNKVFDYHYIYTWDEGKIGDPRVSRICAMIHQADPQLKNMVCYHGFWEPDKNPEWGKDIDIWCFQIDSFNERKMRALKDLGKEIWMYVSGPGGKGSPNLAIDFDSIDYRIIPWLCWKYDIKGFLYWSVNWWPFVDPFKSAMNTKWEQNGNGLMYYPGEDGPIASLRLEVFRDGIEDYEYLYLLAERIRQIEDRNLSASGPELIKKAKELLAIDKSIISSPFSFTKDSRTLTGRRRDIAEAIEGLGKILNIESPKETYLQITEDFTKPVEVEK